MLRSADTARRVGLQEVERLHNENITLQARVEVLTVRLRRRLGDAFDDDYDDGDGDDGSVAREGEYDASGRCRSRPWGEPWLVHATPRMGPDNCGGYPPFLHCCCCCGGGGGGGGMCSLPNRLCC